MCQVAIGSHNAQFGWGTAGFPYGASSYTGQTAVQIRSGDPSRYSDGSPPESNRDPMEIVKMVKDER
jgi:hypothetical protein